MNHLPRFLCLGALLLTPALFAADSFVGKVSFAMTTSNGKAIVLNYSMNGTAFRTDFEGMPGGMIMDLSKKEMIILMSEQRMYMVRPIKASDIPQEVKVKAAAARGETDIEVTGKTEKILGYECNQILVKDAKNTTEIWAAEGLGVFGGLGNQGGGGMFGKRKGNAEAAAKWEQALKGKGGFPLRVITRDGTDKEIFRMEATKIQKGGVTDADFQPPADYKKFEMPDLGGLNPFR